MKVGTHFVARSPSPQQVVSQAQSLLALGLGRFAPMTRDEILTVYQAGPEAVIALVDHLLAVIAQQQHTINQQQQAIERLDARVRELEARPGQNSLTRTEDHTSELQP